MSAPHQLSADLAHSLQVHLNGAFIAVAKLAGDVPLDAVDIQRLVHAAEALAAVTDLIEGGPHGRA